VDDLDGVAVGVAGADQFGAEGQDAGVGCDERAVVVAYQLAAGGDPLGLRAAATGAGAVGGDFHQDGARGGDGLGGGGGGGMVDEHFDVVNRGGDGRGFSGNVGGSEHGGRGVGDQRSRGIVFALGAAVGGCTHD